MKTVKVLLSVAICLFLASMALAQENPEILPDSPLYQAKRQMETAELNAGLDPLQKATLHTKYAEERLQEIKTMVSKGKPEFVEGLVSDYGVALNGAMDEIDGAQAQGRDVNDALNAVESSTKKHTEVLMGILEKVPEQARPAITRAMETSQQGRNRALDVLSKIQRGEIPLGKPEDAGKPAGVGSSEKRGSTEEFGKPESAGRPTGIPSGRPSGTGGRGGRGR